MKLQHITLFLACCLGGCSAPREKASDLSDIAADSENEAIQTEGMRTPSNASVEDGLYRIKPTIGTTFEYSAETEKEYQQLEELQKKIDKGELNYDDLPGEDQLELDELTQSGGYWSIGVSPGPTWSSEFPPQKISASSTLAASKKTNYEVSNLIDYDLRTVWSEGAKGNGIGESISFQYATKNEYGSPTVLTSVTILNGFVRSNDLWKKNGRVKVFKLYINDKPFALLELEDSKAFQTFDLGSISSPDGFTLKFEINEVYPGEVYEDVVVSNFEFQGDGVLCFAAETEIELADGSMKTIDEIQPGDGIVSFDRNNNSLSVATVEQVGKSFHNNLVEIELDDRSVIVTSDHPFLSDSFQWVAVNNHGRQGIVGKLQEGITIRVKEKGTICSSSVKSIRYLKGSLLTYAITKTSTNQSYVANGMLVAVETPDSF